MGGEGQARREVGRKAPPVPLKPGRFASGNRRLVCVGAGLEAGPGPGPEKKSKEEGERAGQPFGAVPDGRGHQAATHGLLGQCGGQRRPRRPS